MRSAKLRNTLIAFILGLGGLLFSTFAIAKDVKLYDQPKDDAKVVGSIDPEVGMVPIFSQADGTWMKVGDPRNGNVGWIKASDLSGNASPYTSINFTQKVIQDSKGVPRTYQILQYGDPTKLDNAQIQDISKQIQKQQKAIQQSVEMSVQRLMNDLYNMYKQQQELFNKDMPVFMPVIIFPQQGKPDAHATQPDKNKAGSAPKPTTKSN